MGSEKEGLITQGLADQGEDFGLYSERGGPWRIAAGLHFKRRTRGGTWLTQSVGHPGLDLGIVSSSPILGVAITIK